MTTNFIELLRPHVEATPDFEVLTFDHEGVAETRTYAQLWKNGHQLAAALAQLGLKKGERFALLLANHPESVEAMLASSLLGAQFVAIDPRASGEKLAFMLQETQCQGVILADYSRANFDSVQPRLSHLNWVLELGGQYQALLAKDWPAPVYAQDPAMQLIFTSGTTGDPKAIVMTQQRFCATASLAAKAFGYEPNDVLYSGLSLTHANAQLVTLGAALAQGIKAVFSRRFRCSTLWETCRR